jgi:hypothetical protein
MLRPALAACLLLVATGPALAWSIPTCTRLDQGQPLCEVTAWYDLGGQAGMLKIMLADGEPYLLVQHEAWHLARGRLTVLAHVDDQPPVERDAATRDDGVLITLLDGDLHALANGHSLTLAMPQAEITYPLVGSLRALEDLLASYAAFDASGASAGFGP